MQNQPTNKKTQIKLPAASVANLAPPNTAKQNSVSVWLNSKNNNNKKTNFNPRINLFSLHF